MMGVGLEVIIKLRHSFGGHSIIVLMSHTLKSVLQKLYISRRLAHIAIKLNKFDIHFKPHLVIKGQVVADFIADWMEEGIIQIVEAHEALVEKNC